MISLNLILFYLFASAQIAPVGCISGTLLAATDLRAGLLIAKPANGGIGETQQIVAKGPFHFQLCELKNAGQPIDVFYRGVMADTLYVGTLGASTSETSLTYPITVRKNVLGYWICPKCHRADKTLEMVYGDGIPLNLASRKRPMGCINNGPRGYCGRDKIYF